MADDLDGGLGGDRVDGAAEVAASVREPTKAERKAAKRARKAAKRRKKLTRLAVVWFIVAALSILSYAAVVLSYGLSTQPKDRPEILNPEAIQVFLQPSKVQPAEGVMLTDLTVTPPQDLTNQGLRLDYRIDIQYFTYDGSGAASFEAGKPALALTTQAPIRIDGSQYTRYPLDHYTSLLGVVALVETPQGRQLYPVEVAIWSDVAGWQVQPNGAQSARQTPGPISDDVTLYVAQIDLDVKRAGSTIGIVTLLLIALVAVACLAIAIAVAVSRRTRRTEATLAGWFAALLFAVVPLRLNMPGSPPIGAWLDFLVFMWVVLALMLALVVFVLSWLRFSAPPDRPNRKHKRKGHKRAHPPAGSAGSDPGGETAPAKPPVGEPG